MENIKKLQNLIQKFAEVPFKGVYLWKYIEYELTSGIIPDFQMLDKNVAIQGGLSDIIPDAPNEQIEDTKKCLDNLSEKEILFGMVPLRRAYNGKLEHTAMDAYVLSIEDDKYTVIEPDLGGQEDEIVYTKNRRRFYPLGVIGYYGQEETDIHEILEFLIETYIYPIEMTFNTKVPKHIVIKCVYKASVILKERKAYISFFEEVLKRVKPKVVCFTHGPDPVLCFLNEAAQKNGIPTVEIEHGGIIRNLIYPKTLSYSEYYLTHSDLLTKPMRENGLQNVYTVGKPGVYLNVQQNIDERRPVVIGIISSLEPDLYKKALELAKRLDKQKYLVVYKMHSAEICEDEEMSRVLNENQNWQFLHGSVDVRDLFALSDIVIGVRSSGLLDALPFSKIKILALKDKSEKELLVGNLSFFYELGRLGDITLIEDDEQLYQEVISYERGKQYRNRINHYWPEDGEERFKNFMEIFLEGRRP